MEKNLTVIIPTFNTGNYLKLALDSVFKNSKYVKDVIVFVDGSTDNTLDILKEYPHPIQVLYSETNVGQTHGWNAGVEMAKTPYVVLLNDDMVVGPEWDKAPMEIFDDVDNVVVSSQLVEPGTQLTPINAHTYNCGDTAETFNYDKFESFAIKNKKENIIFKMNLPMFLSKKDFLTVGGWDSRFATGPMSDHDFRAKLSLLGRKFWCCQDSIVYHFSGKATRFSGDSKTQTNEFNQNEQQNRSKFYNKWGFVQGDEVYKLPFGNTIRGVTYDRNTN